jgi:hypothetical protein
VFTWDLIERVREVSAIEALAPGSTRWNSTANVTTPDCRTARLTSRSQSLQSPSAAQRNAYDHARVKS